MLLASMAAVGLLAVVTQALVAYAASLSRPEERGQVVGTVTSGIVLGILLARTAAGLLTDLSGLANCLSCLRRSNLLIAALLYRSLLRQQNQRRGSPIRDWSFLRSSRPCGGTDTAHPRGDCDVDIRQHHKPPCAACSAVERTAIFNVAHASRAVWTCWRCRCALGGALARGDGPTRVVGSAPPASQFSSCRSPGCQYPCSSIRSCG